MVTRHQLRRRDFTDQRLQDDHNLRAANELPGGPKTKPAPSTGTCGRPSNGPSSELTRGESQTCSLLCGITRNQQSRRGWNGSRFTYASHGLRFELRAPNETTAEFVRRVNRVAAKEEDQTIQPASGTDSWALGPNQRNKGSLHQDIWRGHGAELATTGVIAVHAVGGWWKYNSRKDRQDLSVRYALLVSLRTPMQDVDIYTPIATSIGVPVERIARSKSDPLRE